MARWSESKYCCALLEDLIMFDKVFGVGNGDCELLLLSAPHILVVPCREFEKLCLDNWTSTPLRRVMALAVAQLLLLEDGKM